MSTTGAHFPGTGAAWSVTPWDDQTWTNPGNIIADDTSYAQITAPAFDLNVRSYLLRASNFDFSEIPAGAIIDGITVRVCACYVNGSGSIDHVRLVDASGALVGDNKASTPVALTTPTMAVYTFGGAADTWAASPTQAMLQDVDFGVAVGFIATANDCDLYVDYVTIEVEYHTSEAHSGSAAITGNGSQVAVGQKGGKGSAAISALGAVVALGVAAMFGLASISGNGAVAAIGQKGASDIASISGGGSIVAVGEKETYDKSGSAAISGGGVITAVGTKGGQDAAAITGNGTVTAATSKGGQDAASVSGGGALAGAGTKGGAGAGAVSGSGSLVGVGTKQGMGNASVSGGGSLVAVGHQTVGEEHSGSAAITGGGSVAAFGVKGAWQTDRVSPTPIDRTALAEKSKRTAVATPADRTALAEGSKRTATASGRRVFDINRRRS